MCRVGHYLLLGRAGGQIPSGDHCQLMIKSTVSMEQEGKEGIIFECTMNKSDHCKRARTAHVYAQYKTHTGITHAHKMGIRARIR